MSDEIHHKQELKKLYELIQQYEKQFIHFGFSYINDSEAAKDYVFESFMEYWSNRKNLDDHANIPGYILTVLKHKCLNHLRHKKTQQIFSERFTEIKQWELNLQINSLCACEPNQLFESEIYDIINTTLKSFPINTRRVFYLSRFKHKNRNEIAQILNMSPKGVEYHLSRALKTLRQKLKDYLVLLF